MVSRRHWQFGALAAAAAFFIAGCGGGSGLTGANEGPVAKRVIMFGDSLSDLGTYTPATQIPLGQAAGVPPFFGGKFTNNMHTGYTAASNSSISNTWVEWVASRVGVPITPAEVGFITTRVPCPAAASLPGSCTGYAQGGSRVTDPNGIGKSSGALTIPMVAQIASHNTRTVTGFRTGFDADDIVFVWGGNNDAFAQFGAAGTIGPAAAVTNMQTAATELANLVKNEILAKGATRVAVLNLPDAAKTPGFAGSPYTDGQRALLTQLSAEFNTTLTAALAGTAARVVDARAFNADVYANPSKFGITNVTTPVCDAAKVSTLTGGRVTDGSSLFCNTASATALSSLPAPLNTIVNTQRAGTSTSTYAFADGVHPTTGAHKVLSDFVIEQIKGFGWIPPNL